METGNPYSYDEPIQDGRDFFGRHLELQHVQEAIEGKACLSFVGEPRSGLTSLLRHIAGEPFRTRCEASCGPLKFIYVDCTVVEEDPLSLLTYLLEQLGHPSQSLPNWRMAFGRLVAAVDHLQPTRLAIIFDDFECIGRQEAYADLTEHLRALCQRSDMTLVTATHTELKNCCHMKVVSSPFPNMFHVEYLGSFTLPEAQEFIASTSRRSGVDLVPYQERIVALSGLHPYYLQMACQEFYGACQATCPSESSMDERFLEAARSSFDDIWMRLDTGERAAIYALASEDSPQEGAPLGIPPRLLHSGYLQRAGPSAHPRLFSQAFQDYVSRKL